MIHTGATKRKRDDVELEAQQVSYNQFNELIARISLVKEQDMPVGLRVKIAQHDLERLLAYFDINKQSAQTRRLANRDAHLEAIKHLTPNSAYRLSKEETGLPRSLTVLRDKDGKYLLIAETKSKLSNNQKAVLPSIGGAYKKGKSAWRIDSYQEYFNLVTILKPEEDGASQRDEVDFSNLVDSPYINHLLMGPCLKKENIKKISIYSEKALGNLEDLLSKQILTRAQRLDIIEQLLAGLRHMHDHNLVHQDLRLENVLVYLTPDGQYRVKISDFGNTSGHRSNEGSCATINYASPELVQYYQQPDTSQTEYFTSIDQYRCYGRQPYPLKVLRHFQHPDKQNDIWAMGVLIFQIIHGTFPDFPEDRSLVKGDCLLSGMLMVERNKRFTIDQAIESFEQNRRSANRTHHLK